LQNPQTKPEWFPSHRLWIGLERWGNESAAAVIEARVQEAGGATREESLSQRKARLERKIVSKEKRKAFLESDQAVQPAIEEAQTVLNKMGELSKSLSTSDFPLQAKRESEAIEILTFGFVLRITWYRKYTNSLSESGLFVRLLQRSTDD
jgi:hypothetical protein